MKKSFLKACALALVRGGLAAGLCSACAAQAAPTLLVFGDSLSAGYGIDPGSGWVALLDTRLKAQSSPALKAWSVVNVSVSGETTAGGLSRLPAALAQYHPQLLLIELGANDALRGQPVAAMRANLEKMADLGSAAKARPVLMEMRIPTNYGPIYTGQFVRAFTEVAQPRKLALVPFFLAPLVSDRPRWFQDDDLHPNATAQPLLLDAVWPTLQPLLAHPAGS